MVDFKKRLKHPVVERPVEPLALYDTLDRKSDKGPLRDVQRAVVGRWYSERRSERDTVLKMHTGQGKTLVGLLILQSRLNAGHRRSLYLCPNRFLTGQTLTQAKEFGIAAVGIEDDGQLPEEFLNGDSILVATVQKLFNGHTKFGLGASSVIVDTVVLDDAHACVDAIKEACVITATRKDPAYHELLNLFRSELVEQGPGTFADIETNSAGSLLPIPYWAWHDHHEDVARVLARHAESDGIKFAWPIVRDRLNDCYCIVSGTGLSIAPHHPPLELFGSYHDAAHRVFMSASVTDDAFLVRGLGLDPSAIGAPLVDPAETWSGERMILMPSLIDGNLDRDSIIALFGSPQAKRTFGVVALVPSFEHAGDWAKAGAIVAKKTDIDEKVAALRAGPRGQTLAIANRYDGIDLPDSSCRILILDGKPQGVSLLDRYHELSRPGSAALSARVARIIEQGLGRAVRGEKDYCAVLIIASDLVKALRLRETREFFAPQTRAQVELGLEISEYARQDLAVGGNSRGVLIATINQCLKRDTHWKDFYAERMNSLPAVTYSPSPLLDLYVAEREAERLYQSGEHEKAVARLQQLLDSSLISGDSEKGWYLQEMARYKDTSDRVAANVLQAAAHRKNRYLLKPRSGMHVSRLAPRSDRRVDAIIKWVRSCGDHETLTLSVEALLTDLRFGVASNRFEAALNSLALALGFNGERPDKEWKAGPDNLWAVRDSEYILFECKSEVEPTRESINKHESGQMNNSCAWFVREYPGAVNTSIMIIPTKKLGSAAGFNQSTRILRQGGLRQLVKAVRSFFRELMLADFDDLLPERIEQLIALHGIGIDNIIRLSEEPVHTRG